MNRTRTSPMDALLGTFDRAIRILAGITNPGRPAPDAQEAGLSDQERRHAAGLMRVNHTGEVCAQALYEGQALTTRSAKVRRVLERAAAEEVDHLSWCRQRLEELEGRRSVLDPLFYAVSATIGAVTGAFGDRVSLGFVEATEDQVVRHLDRHLASLPETDERSRLILKQMRDDESRHGANALRAGGITFPEPVKRAMAAISRVMTETTYRI
jgi:ubiquinone biosynthesis monooxygenase Coq7